MPLSGHMKFVHMAKRMSVISAQRWQIPVQVLQTSICALLFNPSPKFQPARSEKDIIFRSGLVLIFTEVQVALKFLEFG